MDEKVREKMQIDKELLKLCPEAKPYLRDTGCVKCDCLPPPQICIDCAIAEADANVARAMRILEELKQKKEKENE